jgi:hypothetical protein
MTAHKSPRTTSSTITPGDEITVNELKRNDQPLALACEAAPRPFPSVLHGSAEVRGIGKICYQE